MRIKQTNQQNVNESFTDTGMYENGKYFGKEIKGNRTTAGQGSIDCALKHHKREINFPTE